MLRHPSCTFGIVLLLAGSVSAGELRYSTIAREKIEERLKGFEKKNTAREQKIRSFFAEAQCPDLVEQPVRGLKQPNVVCTLKGETDDVILIGAHFDFAGEGDGVADNWAGAAILPSLLQGLVSQPRRKHTFVFVAFAGEEEGLVGSNFFAKNLSPEHVGKIHAMVTIDTIGLGPTKVWAHRSDPHLAIAILKLGEMLQLPVSVVNVDQVGASDEEGFIKRKIPVVVVHSVTQETWSLLHSDRDRLSAIKLDDYYGTYRLLAAYLNVLDEALPLPPKPGN